MTRLAVKLILLDVDDRVLLIHAKDPKSQSECWYPVGGRVEPGESVQTAAAREACEETGLTHLPTGTPVWRRVHRYEFNGQAFDVHEEWLLHRVEHFSPAPANLSASRPARSSASAGGAHRSCSTQQKPSSRHNSVSC